MSERAPDNPSNSPEEQPSQEEQASAPKEVYRIYTKADQSRVGIWHLEGTPENPGSVLDLNSDILGEDLKVLITTKDNTDYLVTNDKVYVIDPEKDKPYIISVTRDKLFPVQPGMEWNIDGKQKSGSVVARIDAKGNRQRDVASWVPAEKHQGEDSIELMESYLQEEGLLVSAEAKQAAKDTEVQAAPKEAAEKSKKDTETKPAKADNLERDKKTNPEEKRHQANDKGNRANTSSDASASNPKSQSGKQNVEQPSKRTANPKREIDPSQIKDPLELAKHYASKEHQKRHAEETAQKARVEAWFGGPNDEPGMAKAADNPKTAQNLKRYFESRPALDENGNLLDSFANNRPVSKDKLDLYYKQKNEIISKQLAEQKYNQEDPGYQVIDESMTLVKLANLFAEAENGGESGKMKWIDTVINNKIDAAIKLQQGRTKEHKFPKVLSSREDYRNEVNELIEFRLKMLQEPEKTEAAATDETDEGKDESEGYWIKIPGSEDVYVKPKKSDAAQAETDTVAEVEQADEEVTVEPAQDEAADQAEAAEETPTETPAAELADVVELPEAEPTETVETSEEIKISLEDTLKGIKDFGAKLKNKDYVPTANEYRQMVELGKQIKFTQITENGPLGYYIGGMKQDAYACRSFLDGIRADRWLLSDDDKAEGDQILDVSYIVDLESQPKQRIQNYDLLKFDEFERNYEQKHNADYDEEEILSAYKQYVESRLELDGRLSEQNLKANKANAQNLYSEALNEFTESRPDNRAKKAKIRESLGYIASGLKRRR